ncbi:MAG: coenzyme F420-0:L-glutamate ligase [Alphaproteobacteria bacterium]|nr:coenzyme F420-0:L-glutamate ligase [Alphaproteobacteria bacterium]
MRIDRLTLHALPGIPLVRPGDDLASLILAALKRCGLTLATGDVLVLAQKIVSKSEGRYVDVRHVVPSPAAVALAKEVGKDPRFVELVLGESAEVVRRRPGIIVVAHKLGFVLANAGIDHSNIEPIEGAEADAHCLLLPVDPDASSARLRAALGERTQADVGIIIADSVGRAWRQGTVGIAIGVAGLKPLVDLRGQPDLFGRSLMVTQVGVADEVAAAAGLLMGQADEGCPAVLVRGLARSGEDGTARELVRPKEQDMFR